jgi:SAM-dependent methyltransferase
MTALATRVAALPSDRQKLLGRLLEKGSLQASSAAAPLSPQDPVKQECLASYDALNQSLDATVFGKHSRFLNYGYVPDSSPQYSAVGLPDYCFNKNSVRLVLETIADCDVNRRRILDVGCGRGGTVSVLFDYFHPASVNAVDLSAAAIAFCRASQHDTRARFDQADAEQLPFGHASFDVVINIESSCCYPHVEVFYREVHRVLRPAGWFLYTDCLPAEKSAWALRQLAECGFALIRDRDITSNVLRSCDEVARARIGSFGAPQRDGALGTFLGVPGSLNYENMRTGRSSYRIRTLQKRVNEAAS